MKNIVVVVAESTDPYDLVIKPGTTAREILDQMSLGPEYLLSNGRGQEPFGSDENVYSVIPDGAKLYAMTAVKVATWPPSRISRLAQNCYFKGKLFLRQLCKKFHLTQKHSKAQLISNRAHFLNNKNVKPTLVKRDTRPYWAKRGWRGFLGKYTGWYRTQFGSWKGRAIVSPSGRIDLFIFAPPYALRRHPHWPCFFRKESDWYFVHVQDQQHDLSSGVIRIEQILTEAFTK